MILTDISLKRPVFATVTILALIVLGLVGYMSLNVDEWPDVEFPYVTVVVNYPGASPEQVDSKVINKVEEAVSAISGVKHIYSTAREGSATTTIEFTLETDPAKAAQDVRDKIGRTRGELPQDVDEPIIMRFDPSEMPIVSLILTGNMSEREMTSYVDDVVKHRLETIDGVGSVDIQGSMKREIQINLDKQKLAAYNLSVSEVIESLRQDNLEAPGGKVGHESRDISLRTAANLNSAEEFLNIPIARRDNIQLYVKNIASVYDGTVERTSITRLNGSPAIGLDIMKQSGTNTVKVAAQVKKAVETLQQELPPGAQLIIVRDNSVNIKESVNDVLFNLILGGGLAVLIVFLFLGNWRSTLISAIAIPASIIATFFTMTLLHFTLNSMSLMGLSLAVGLLIDDAIVVIENIVRHMEMGKEKAKAALEGTSEIGLAVTATTLSLVAVFVPVGMMTGIVGQFFKQFGITVAFAVLVSLFIAFTLTPLLSSRYLDVDHGQNRGFLGTIINSWNSKFDKVTFLFADFLHKALLNRGKVILAAGILFILSLGLVPLLGSNFMTEVDNGEFTVQADIDPGMSLEGATNVSEQITTIIRQMPEVKYTYSVVKADKLNIFVKLTDKQDRKRDLKQITDELRNELANVPGINPSIMKQGGFGSSKPVEIVVRGESLDILATIAEQAEVIMANTKGAVDITSSYQPGKPDVNIAVKRDRAADLGVSPASIGDTLRSLFTGTIVSQFKDGDDRYDVRLRLAESQRKTFEDLEGIYLASKNKDARGNTIMVPLSQVTEANYSTSPTEILRYDRQKEIKLSANLEGASLGEFNKEFSPKLKAIELPPGYEIVSTGEAERMGESFTAIGMALALSVIFIFFVLAAQFESYIDPFSIMFSLPLAIIGAILGLLVMGSDLSITSLIGVIMLMGLVTKNAILLIDFAKQRMAEGIPREKALVEAARIRMRPIMMTTAAMIFGMLPIAVGIGPGAEARAPMAHAIIGGLITSTVLTLVVVPVMYTILNDIKFTKNPFKRILGNRKLGK